MIFCLVRRSISSECAASFAFVYDHVAFFRIDLYADRLKLTATIRRAIARIDVEMKGPEAEGTVVACGVAERLDLLSTVRADKGFVEHCKSFAFEFHKSSFRIVSLMRFLLNRA